MNSAGSKWVSEMRLAVSQALPVLSPRAQTLVVAHAAYESGYGTAKACRAGFNPFNLTAGRHWTGPTIEGGDLEYRNGVSVPITQSFRAYPSLRVATKDYWRFLATTENAAGEFRYMAALFELMSGLPDAFVGRLSDAGYFTLPVLKYLQGFNAVLESLENP